MSARCLLDRVNGVLVASWQVGVRTGARQITEISAYSKFFAMAEL